MKQKLLLFLLMVPFGLFAQTDTIRTLIFSEIRSDSPPNAYIIR